MTWAFVYRVRRCRLISMDNAQYFDQASVWSDSAHEYQVQVGKDVAHLVPADVVQVLDVGCGNGLITGDLASKHLVFGVDQSAVALAASKSPVAQATAQSLPFADASFDLVMTTDMLEHVSELEDAVRELVRVSRKYVLITVPYAEDLKSKYACCENCRAQFHINHHLRSFDVALLKQVEGWIGPLLEMRLSGGIGKPPPDEFAQVRHAAGCFMDWPGSKCPVCGAAGTAGPASDIKRAMLNSLRGAAWAERLLEQGLCEDRSEVMCLFAINESVCSEAMLAKPGELGSIRKKNLCSVRFDQAGAGAEFVAGAQFSGQHRIPGSSLNGKRVYQVSFPVPLMAGDKIELELEGNDSVSVSAVHGVLGDKTELPLCDEVSQSRRTYLIEEDTACSQYGGLIEVVIGLSVEPLGCELKRAGPEVLEADFVSLEPGPNIVTLGDERQRFSWSLHCDSTMQHPNPMPALMRLREEYQNAGSQGVSDQVQQPSVPGQLLSVLDVVDSLSSRVRQISKIANDVELQRSTLEEKIVQLDLESKAVAAESESWTAQLEAMNAATNNLEAQRKTLSEALMASNKLVEAKTNQLTLDMERHRRDMRDLQAYHLEAQRKVAKLGSITAELESEIEKNSKLNQIANELETKRMMLEGVVQSKDAALEKLEKAYNELLSKFGKVG